MRKNLAIPVHRRGVFMADIAIGLTIVATLAVVLFLSLAREQRLARQMADARAATRQAEAVLTGLQASRSSRSTGSTEAAAQSPKEQARVVVVRRADGGGSVPGRAWVRVRVTVADRSAEMVGLVPDGPELLRLESQQPATSPAAPEAP